MDAAEVIRRNNYPDHTMIRIQVDRTEFAARIVTGRDYIGRAFGFVLWLTQSPPVQYATQQEALAEACRLADLMAHGVINYVSDEDFAAGDRAELRT